MLSRGSGVIAIASLAAIGCTAVMFAIFSRKSEKEESAEKAYTQLIGKTALVELPQLSKLTGCRMFAKMESMNPGGTGKDRAAKYMLQEALRNYYANNTMIDHSIVTPPEMFEGTSGSTGIALACLCNAMALKLNVVMPDDQADEKRALLERLGVKVTVVPCCGISNRNHYVNTAKRMAKESNGIFLDQFENLANFQAHYDETGPEIWTQTVGKVDAFVMSAGTGGTIAGISRYLKGRKPSVRIVLADPTGSSLFHRVKHGVCYTVQQAEKTVKKHRYDSIVEGVGLDRLTSNFKLALIDDAERIVDQEILDTAHYLLREEGLFVGSSSAMNVAAACRVALSMPKGSVIVTIICDSGQRHLSRFWNPTYISEYNLTWPAKDVIPSYLI